MWSLEDLRPAVRALFAVSLCSLAYSGDELCPLKRIRNFCQSAPPFTFSSARCNSTVGGQGPSKKTDFQESQRYGDESSHVRAARMISRLASTESGEHDSSSSSLSLSISRHPYRSEMCNTSAVPFMSLDLPTVARDSPTTEFLTP